MKKILLLMMAVAMVAVSASATKIYVCGTKITGSTSFSAGGGTVNYNASSNTLTISNVDYTKSGSSNNGISVDEVSSDLTINLNGTVKFTIGDADAVLCKDANKHKTYININGTSTFISKSSGHAGLKLQDCNVEIKGSGTLTIQNTSSSSSACAIKGGTRNEYLTFEIKNCTLESNGPRLNYLREVNFSRTSYYDSGDYSTRSTTITLKPGSSNTVHAKDISNFYEWYVHIFLPIDNYCDDLSTLTSTSLAGKQVVLSNYTPAVVINAKRFPDANLFSHLRYLEPQGWLTTSAMNAYTYMNISDKNISNLKGLDQYENLKDLMCYNNNLTSLTWVPSSLQTLDCSNNKITSFDYLQYCTSLKYLNCSNNQISSLNNLPTNIESLYCSNNKFTILNFCTSSDHYYTKYPNLKTLNCSNNTQLTELWNSTGGLTSLDVSGCTSLTKIVCDANKISSLSSIPSSVKNLNLSSNQLTSLPTLPSGLETLSATSNKFTSFSLSNHSSIKILQIGNNPNLTSLTINNNSKLEKVYAYYTTSSCTINCNNNSSLTILNVEDSPGLKTLNCYGNTALTSLWLTNCSSLTTLDCHGSALTGIGSLNNCTALSKLICNNNQLTSLDVSSLSNLTLLYCYDNKLTSLNVSNKTKLGQLQAYRNQLTSINVQGCSALQNLGCAENKLSSLSVQGCNALTTLNCWGNQIKGSAMTSLINTLRTIPAGSTGDLDVIYPGQSIEGNVITDAQVRAARTKRWIPKKWTGSSWVEIPSVITGDVNNDGNVTSADVTAIYNYLLNNDSSQLINGDVNGDGMVTSADVTEIYNILLQ